MTWVLIRRLFSGGNLFGYFSNDKARLIFNEIIMIVREVRLLGREELLKHSKSLIYSNRCYKYTFNDIYEQYVKFVKYYY